MRISAYVHLERTINPTGVGKHILHMVRGLAHQPDVALEMLADRRTLYAMSMEPAASAFAGISVRTFALPRFWLERAWLFARFPVCERWTGPVDWVYSPAEVCIPTKKARTAVTVHCADWIDPDVPWYDSTPALRKDRRRWGLRLANICRHADLILTVSQFLAGRLTAILGVPRSRVKVVGNGVEDVFFDPHGQDTPPASAETDRSPYVLLVGGLNFRRGGGPTLKVAQELLDRHSDLRILVVGTGDADLELQAQAFPNVKQLGYVSTRCGLVALMRGAVALLLLARYESFGIPAAEAQALGTPVVVSHHAALPEVVGDGGAVVDPEHTSEIADLLIQLARDCRVRKSFSDAGRKHSERFRWEKCVTRALAAMQENS